MALNGTEMFVFFRSFGFNHHNQLLTYEDVLFGVAAMDRSTPHGGPSGELRCRYIFKFYSTEQEGFLSFDEFKYVAIKSLVIVIVIVVPGNIHINGRSLEILRGTRVSKARF